MTWNEFFDRLLHAVFPDRCAFCGEPVAYNQGICDHCRPALQRQDGPICTGCGRSKPYCQCNEDGKQHWDGAIAPFVYEHEGITGNAVRRLKRSHNRKNAATLGHEIAVCVKLHFPDVTFDSVMPSPMTNADELKRGYSQSRWIAQTVADDLNVPFEDKLKKTMQTAPQKTLPAAKRRVNLRGAIDLGLYDAPDRTVLVVDDLITTGSTVDECARILKIYGARAVYVAAACIVYRKGNECDAGSKAGD